METLILLVEKIPGSNYELKILENGEFLNKRRFECESEDLEINSLVYIDKIPHTVQSISVDLRNPISEKVTVKITVSQVKLTN